MNILYFVGNMDRNLSHSALDDLGRGRWLNYFYGVLYLLIATAAILANGTLIYVLSSEKLRNRFKILLLGLCIDDFLMSLAGTFLTALAHLFGSEVLYSPICQAQGVIMAFLGLLQIVLLSAISFTRFVIVCYPTFRLRFFHAKCIVGGSYAYSLLVAMCPLFGWGSYISNNVGTSCEPTWASTDINHISFNIFLFLSCLILPIIFICSSYVMIFVKIRKQFMKLNVKKIRLTYTVLVMIAFFMLSWTPYTIFSIHKMVEKNWKPNPSLVDIPGLCAKSSALWNPVIYFFRDVEFRKVCRKHLKFLQKSNQEQKILLSHGVLRRRKTEELVLDSLKIRETYV